MNILYLLIPISVLLVFLIGLVFWWSVHSGQFDDLEGPAYRILMDDCADPVGDPQQVKEETGTETGVEDMAGATARTPSANTKTS